MSLRALYDLPAPAKLNLFLHVVGRRADGYHLLESVFVLIDWADTVHLECRSDGRLQRHDLGPALPADDLCLRAARALQADSGCTLGADISVLKQVPWGAGLGGGSSDAATVLLGLNRLWGLNWTRTQLAELGLRLGADVPFFIGGGPAFVQGVGERLSPMQLQPACFAVVKPPEAIPTRDIFAHALLKRDSETVIVTGFPEAAGRSRWPAAWGAEFDEAGIFGRNDLQAAAEQVCPAVAQAAHWLRARFGNSRMSGSGSAVFAKVPAERCNDHQGTVVSPMATFPADELPPGWVGRWCRSLDQHPLQGWAD